MRVCTFLMSLALLSTLPTALAEVFTNPTAETMKASSFHLIDASGKYVSHQRETTQRLVADRSTPWAWERFTIEDLGGGKVALLTPKNLYVTADETIGMELIANRNSRGPWETFTLESVDGGIALKAWNGRYVSADQSRGGLLVADREKRGPWETFKVEPFSIFSVVKTPSAGQRFALKTTNLLCVDVEGEKAAAGTRLILWACKQSVENVGGLSVPRTSKNQRFSFVGGAMLSSDLAQEGTWCVTHHGRGNPVTIELCLGGTAGQSWKVYGVDEKRFDLLGTEGYEGHATFPALVNILANVQIRSPEGLCLDVRGGELLAGRELIAWECKSYGFNQVFLVD